MKTISDNITSELIIKNSRFITKLIKIDSPVIDSYLESVRLEYPKATHYTYAFIYNDIKRSNDDGEPGGTAGMPILNVLENNCLNNVLCVVIRYFGGIKLGAGGLIRAYTKSVTECLKNASLIDLVEGYEIIITFNYNQEKDVNYILNNSIIKEKKYDEVITYSCLVDLEVFKNISKYNPKIISNVLLKKLN